jgi:hypothetical protein
LGSTMARYLMQRLHMNVLGADVQHPPTSPTSLPSNAADAAWELTRFCHLPSVGVSNNSPHDIDATTAMTHTLLRAVHEFVHTTTTTTSSPPRLLDVIVVASGGWEMDPPLAAAAGAGAAAVSSNNHHHGTDMDAILSHATTYLQSMEHMRRENLDPVIAASIVAQYYMNHRNSVLETTVLENDPDDDDDNEDSPTTDQYNGTLMVVLGATAALQPTPGMMGYGLSKNAAHYLVQTMGSCTGGVGSQSQYLYTNLKHAHHNPATSTTGAAAGGGGGGPISNLQDSKLIRQAGRKVRQHVPSLDDLTVIGILPTMLDTPSNRQAHSIPPRRPLPQRSQSQWKTSNRAIVNHNNNHDEDEDEDEDDGIEENPEIQQRTSTWIRPEHIAQEIGHWIQTPALRPHSGALIKVIPRTTMTTNTTNGRVKKGAQFELVR